MSPIFHFAPHGQWRGAVIALWEVLSGFYIVGSNTTCSTHVHVSLLEGWQLEQVKRVARTVIYFESAVEILVPEHRRGNEYSKSNRLSNPKFAGCLVAECIEMINQCDSTVNVANLITQTEIATTVGTFATFSTEEREQSNFDEVLARSPHSELSVGWNLQSRFCKLRSSMEHPRT